jgi:hypothetical protein
MIQRDDGAFPRVSLLVPDILSRNPGRDQIYLRPPRAAFPASDSVEDADFVQAIAERIGLTQTKVAIS